MQHIELIKIYDRINRKKYSINRDLRDINEFDYINLYDKEVI